MKDKAFNWSDEEIVNLETRGNPDNVKLKKPKYKKSPQKNKAHQYTSQNSKTQMLKLKNEQYDENSDSYDEDEDSGDDDIEIKIASNSDNKMYNSDEENAQEVSLISGDESSYDVLLKSSKSKKDASKQKQQKTRV